MNKNLLCVLAFALVPTLTRSQNVPLVLPVLNGSTADDAVRYVGGRAVRDGEDIGAQINAAYASLPAHGGTIVVVGERDGRCYDFSTPVVFGIAGKYVLLEGGSLPMPILTTTPPCLNYVSTTTSNAIALDYVALGQTAASIVYGIKNLTLINNGCRSMGGCGSNAIGIALGGANGAAGTPTFDGLRVIGFGTGVSVLGSAGGGDIWFQNSAFSFNITGFSDPQNDAEHISFDLCRFQGNGTGVSSSASLSISNSTLDSNTAIAVSCTSPAACSLNNDHFENSSADSTHYLAGSAVFSILGGDMRDDGIAGNTDWWMHFAGANFLIIGTILTSEGRAASNVIWNETPGLAVVQNHSPSTLAQIYSNPSLLAQTSNGPVDTLGSQWSPSMSGLLEQATATDSGDPPHLWRGPQTFEGKVTALSSQNNLSQSPSATGTVAVKYASADSVLFVSPSGDDSHDGRSPGSAKLTIAAAYNALPSCTFMNEFYTKGYNRLSWTHCGNINLAAGTYPSSSQISINSPYVEIRGTGGPNAVTLSYTGSAGCYLYWTTNPFSDEFTGFGGLFDVSIDGRNAGPGSCGIETDDASAFRMDNVLVTNFAGAGSIGWYDHATSYYNEKQNIHIILRNNAVNWQVTPAQTAAHYPITTFGYGMFNVECETFSGQTCLLITNGTLSLSTMKLHINQVQPNSTGIRIMNSGSMFGNNLTLHIEAPDGGLGSGYEINAPLNSFSNVGLWNQDKYSYNTPTTNQNVGWPQPWPTFRTLDNNSGANRVVRLNPCPVGGGVAGCNAYDIAAVPQSNYIVTTLPSVSGTLATVVASGTVSVAASNSVGCVDQTAPANGTAPGMKVIVSPVSPQANTQWSGYIGAPNTVDIHVCTFASMEGNAVIYNWSVLP
jgi:hypothetical protein